MYILIFFITAVISEKQQCCFGDYMGDWSDCDKSCGGGERLRQKELLTAADNFWSAAGAWITGSCPEYEAPCSDHQYDKQDCNNIPCREYEYCMTHFVREVIQEFFQRPVSLILSIS